MPLRNKLTVQLVFLAGILSGGHLFADDHIVQPREFHKAILDASESRQENIGRIHRFLLSEPGARALGAARLDPEKVERAVALLDDNELARLAARAVKAQEDFAAGALTNQQLTYIVIALGTAVIILVIVAA